MPLWCRYIARAVELGAGTGKFTEVLLGQPLVDKYTVCAVEPSEFQHTLAAKFRDRNNFQVLGTTADKAAIEGDTAACVLVKWLSADLACK